MKILIKVGRLIATLLMFSPLVVICNYSKFITRDFIFMLVCTILYDIYYYSTLKFDNYMIEQKELYEKVNKNKVPNSKSYEEKEKWYATIGITTLDKYFKNK